MSASASFSETTMAARALRTANAFREAVFVAILLVVWVSTRPYDVPEPGTGGGPDLANQIAFAGLAVASVLALSLGEWRALRPLLLASYALMILWIVASLALALDPGASLRALAFTLIAMFLAASLFGLPRDHARFQSLLFGVVLAVLALAWAGVFALPDIAIHSDVDALEPEHAGSWRGHFVHKNIAGAMMAIFAIIGLYALRSGRRWTGLAILALSLTFLYLTRSKTSLGLLPAAVAIAFVAEKIPSLTVRIGLLLGPVLGLNALTLGSALNPSIATFNREAVKDPTFTGRLDIWRYGFERLAERPWTGFGFESFWLTDNTLLSESKLELAWEAQKIIHGHNGYLDLMLMLGIPGLALASYIFVLRPVLDFHRCRPGGPNQLLAAACIAIWLFVSLCSCLETFHLRRADPIWFALLIATFGLRMTASWTLTEPEPAQPPA